VAGVLGDGHGPVLAMGAHGGRRGGKLWAGGPQVKGAHSLR